MHNAPRTVLGTRQGQCELALKRDGQHTQELMRDASKTGNSPKIHQHSIWESTTNWEIIWHMETAMMQKN